MEPLRRLRILACTKPRRLPGVRWVTLKTEYRSLLNLITMPGRICVAEIMKLLGNMNLALLALRPPV